MRQTYGRVMAIGHRPDMIPAESQHWVQGELERLAIKLRDEHQTQVGISGMALGSDIWWARAVKYAWLDLWAFIPYPEQADGWDNPTDVAIWKEFRSRATYEVMVAQEYSAQAVSARDDAMIANSDLVIAVWNPLQQGGGTAGAVHRAVMAGLPIIHMNPVARATMFVPAGGSHSWT